MFARSSTSNLSTTPGTEWAIPNDWTSIPGKFVNSIPRDRWIVLGAWGAFVVSPAYNWSKLVTRGIAMSGFMFSNQLQFIGDLVM